MACTHNEINSLEGVLAFAKNATRLYIYGMGKYGRALYSFFRNELICFTGFIVTQKSSQQFLNVDVYSLDEISEILTENDSIIIGVGPDLSKEILWGIPESIHARIGVIQEAAFHEIVYDEFKETIQLLVRERPPKPYTGKEEFKNILIIRLDRMGDLIWTSAFLRELRHNFMQAKITIVVAKSNLPILDGCPYVDRVIGYEYSSFEENGGVSREEELLRAKKFAEEYLQQENYDVVFLPRGLEPDSARANVFLAVYSSAKVRIANYFVLNNKLEKWFDALMKSVFSLVVGHDVPKHETEKILDMLIAIGCKVKEDRTEIWKSPGKRDNVSIIHELNILRKNFSKIIAVGLTTQDPQKNWDARNFNKVFWEIEREFSVCFLLLGSKAAAESAKIAKVETCCVDFTGKTEWNDLVNIMEMCDLYFGLDTGLVHVAAALGKPVIEFACQFPWGNDNILYSMSHCCAWRTKCVPLYPTYALDEKCAHAGQCISKQSHCINNISVKNATEILRNFLLYYHF